MVHLKLRGIKDSELWRTSREITTGENENFSLSFPSGHTKGDRVPRVNAIFSSLLYSFLAFLFIDYELPVFLRRRRQSRGSYGSSPTQGEVTKFHPAQPCGIINSADGNMADRRISRKRMQGLHTELPRLLNMRIKWVFYSTCKLILNSTPRINLAGKKKKIRKG